MIEEKTIFKCRGCGEKYFTDMESIDDVSLCKWCNEDEGYETAKFIDACKKSSKMKRWIKV